MIAVADNHRKRVLFYVQHLLGIGHLKRAATLSRAMEAAGFDVTLISGGKHVPGVNIGGAAFVQLPPMRSQDEHFRVMLDDNDQPVDDSVRDARRDLVIETVTQLQPDIVMTELFPFGRRHLRGEIEPMLDAALKMARQPLIVSSVRDILVAPSKPARGPEMVEMVRRWFDLVLLHGDPAMVPFDRTFPLARQIEDRLRYTGYVVDPPPKNFDPEGPGTDEVIVSAGGGALSEPLLRAAIDARAKTRLAGATWRLLAGPSLPEEVFERLKSEAAKIAPEGGIVVERSRPDFTTLLRRCALSISQGGYNTVMDVLSAKIPAVIAPYAGGKETEQTLRAALLRDRGGVQVVWEQEMSPQNLATAVDAALDGPLPSAGGIQTDGAKETAQILASALAKRAA